MTNKPTPEGGQPKELIPFDGLMNEVTFEAFKTLLVLEDVNKNELLRRMVGTYLFLKEVEFRGGSVLIREPHDIFPSRELFIGSNRPPERLGAGKYIKNLLFRKGKKN